MINLKKEIIKLKHFFLNLVLIWLAILFYNTNAFYQGFLRPETQAVIFYLALAYTIFGFVYYL